MSPRTPEDLFATLAALGIATETHRHPAVFTVAESRGVKEAISGAHSKNLFLKDKKGRLFMVTALGEAAIDLKRLHEAIGASGRLSFASADLLRRHLGVEQGSVTPFAAINDEAGTVTVVIQDELLRHGRLNFHPLRNTMTTGISGPDLLSFLRATGHEPVIRALPRPDDVCAERAENPSV